MLRSMPRHYSAFTPRPATGVLAMCGLVAGTALQLQQEALWTPGVYIALATVACMAALLLWRRAGVALHGTSWRRRWLFGLLALVAGFSATGWRATHLDAQRMPAQWEGRDIRVVATIVALPHAVERGTRLRVDVEHAWPVQTPSTRVPLPPHLALTWYGSPPEEGLRAGQRWEWTVRLKAAHGERNPHGRDWELWQWSQGIRATGYVRQGKGVAAPRWRAQTWRAPVAQLRGVLHQRMQAHGQMDERHRASLGVVQALVTGAQSSITRNDWQLFRDTGIAHLVSISGLHITMFAWLAMAIVNALWRRSMRCCLWMPAPVAAGWAGWLLAAAYAVFSGWGVPAQRTIGMLAVVVWMRQSGRQWPWPYVWLCVLTGVVLLDPWSLLQAGFWLSFVAVGVLFAAQPREVEIQGQALGRHARQLLREQVVVGLALAPLTLLLFGQISVVGMLANLLAVPWMTLIITPLAMLGAVLPALWAWVAHGVTAMVWVLEQMAAWPMAVVHFAQPPWWAALAGLLACLWLVMPWGWRVRMLAVPALLPLLFWVPAAPAWGQLELLALDVGQGSAVLLRTRNHSVLFDAGPRWSEHADAGERTVVPVLRALGLRPTVMMISHADGDHAGGAASVQQAFPGLQWLGAGGVACVRGQSWQWDGVQFEVLHPPQTLLQQHLSSSNAGSCVLRVHSVTGQRVLLTGDIGTQQEQELLHTGADMQADVVMVPHHGSASSSSASWVARVRPRFAVVQSGYRNRYGHPAASVVQRWEAVGAKVVNTPDCGAVRWHSQNPEILQCERAIARRYWARVTPQ